MQPPARVPEQWRWDCARTVRSREDSSGAELQRQRGGPWPGQRRSSECSYQQCVNRRNGSEQNIYSENKQRAEYETVSVSTAKNRTIKPEQLWTLCSIRVYRSTEWCRKTMFLLVTLMHLILNISIRSVSYADIICYLTAASVVWWGCIHLTCNVQKRRRKNVNTKILNTQWRWWKPWWACLSSLFVQFARGRGVCGWLVWWGEQETSTDTYVFTCSNISRVVNTQTCVF